MPKKTSTEYVRAFRARQRANQPPKRAPKTAAERCREYRARKKALENAVRATNFVQDSALPTRTSQEETAIPTQSQENDSNTTMAPMIIDRVVPYSNYAAHQAARNEFDKKIKNNSFGHVCNICERLWFKGDLKTVLEPHHQLLQAEFPGIDVSNFKACYCCFSSLNKNRVPTFSTSNGFKYQEKPAYLPDLDLVSERLISPSIPFMQIRRLRRTTGQYGIFGQVINVPVDVNLMINKLPRDINDDYCINVHIKRKIIHKSSYLIGLINKNTIKIWLEYLCNTPLYKFYGIQMDNSFFNQAVGDPLPIDEVTEDIPDEDWHLAQQQTLMWSEDKYLAIAPGERNVPHSLLFDEHAEELSFPQIYLGHFRVFKEGLSVTSFMMATSELRRLDRRGVTSHHLLYVAMKIMRQRVRDSLKIAFKHIGHANVTKEQIESEEYVNQAIETNLAFLKCIPNSAYYWADRKKDSFAMIRQYGKPTLFLTLSANETEWGDLIKLLWKLKHNGIELLDDILEQMSYIQKCTLINEDPVVCAIYFNKIVNVILNLLQSKKSNPFGEFRVIHYFKRIEFQHRGTPDAHILLWIEGAPEDLLHTNRGEAIAIIDKLISVSKNEASGHINLQTHRHTFTCYKRAVSKQHQKCRFEIPFMPSKQTTILIPMKDDEEHFQDYRQHYIKIRQNLETNNYVDMNTFYKENDVRSDDHYIKILRAGITRPRIFLKRLPSEKCHNAFNPFILNVLQSNTDIQYILDEYSCAAYVVEYVNKTNRGISNLQRQILQIMDDHPDFDIVEITKKMGVDMLNTVEMTSQEAAWFLFREPMSKSSAVIVFIPTMWPVERQRVRRTHEEMEKLDIGEESTDIRKENWFDKYQKRPDSLEECTLAQFVAHYNVNNQNFSKRKEARIIRYRNYDMGTDLNEYKREMVTLHIPYRNEENEILAELKFVKIYDENEDLILKRRKQFESNLDIQKTIEICKELCRKDDDDPSHDVLLEMLVGRAAAADPLQEIQNREVNRDLELATFHKLGAIAKRRENLMPNEQFYNFMRMANDEQKELLMHAIHNLLLDSSAPLQVFLTGPAGCGKTFVIRLLMEIYNRYSTTDGYCNAYITCASTGKAAVAIEGTTIHTALKISLSKLLPLSIEVVQQYRTLFKYIKVLIIDEVSMVSAELLAQIDARLKQITGNHLVNFRGIDIILIGDLRQLPPVRATPIYKQCKTTIAGPTLWRGIKFFELNEVMRQSNRIFSTILTKIGDGIRLEEHELQLIESRFFTLEETKTLCPDGIRLFLANKSVQEYNSKILNDAENKIISMASDIFVGCQGVEQEASFRQKLHKMSVLDTGGLPYETIWVMNKSYMLTTNVDVSDGLANGAMGKLVHIDFNSDNEVSRVWMEFPDSQKVGEKLRRKVSAHIQENNISRLAVPIVQRTSTVYMNNSKTIAAKRTHFPVISCLAITIHKSQGGTFDEIVYEYDKSHSQQLVYVALSRVTSINGLYIVTRGDKREFFHGRRQSASGTDLQNEFRRLRLNPLETIGQEILNLMTVRKGISIFTFNCQSLKKHAVDMRHQVIRESSILVLTETWMQPNEPVDVPNFDCIVSFKRERRRAGGVALYRNSVNRSIIATPHMMVNLRQTDAMNVGSCSIGDICSARLRLENGQFIMIVAIYVSPNQRIDQIIEFIHYTLLPYTPAGAALLKKDWGTMPMILSGDFNIDFAKTESQPLIEFLEKEFTLKLSSDRTVPTTRFGTTIDAVFSRFVDNIKSQTFISYFSYHKPIVSVLELTDTITDDQ